MRTAFLPLLLATFACVPTAPKKTGPTADAGPGAAKVCQPQAFGYQYERDGVFGGLDGLTICTEAVHDDVL